MRDSSGGGGVPTHLSSCPPSARIAQGKPPTIFKRDLSGGPGSYILDVRSKRVAEASRATSTPAIPHPPRAISRAISHDLAQVHDTPAKNVRGDLPTVILTPDDDEREMHSLAMTRSIGDYYMQTFGVTWRPEVISVDLHEVRTISRDLAAGLGGCAPVAGARAHSWPRDRCARSCTTLRSFSPPTAYGTYGSERRDRAEIVLRSGRDHTEITLRYDEAFDSIMRPPGAADDHDAAARAFFRDSLARGVETFEDTADNMTAIVVYLGNATPAQPSAGAPSAAGVAALARVRDAAAGSPRAGSPGRALSRV